MLGASSSNCMQWAAVKTHCGWIKLPPQKLWYAFVFGITCIRLAWKGYSPWFGSIGVEKPCQYLEISQVKEMTLRKLQEEERIIKNKRNTKDKKNNRKGKELRDMLEGENKKKQHWSRKRRRRRGIHICRNSNWQYNSRCWSIRKFAGGQNGRIRPPTCSSDNGRKKSREKRSQKVLGSKNRQLNWRKSIKKYKEKTEKAKKSGNHNNRSRFFEL